MIPSVTRRLHQLLQMKICQIAFKVAKVVSKYCKNHQKYLKSFKLCQNLEISQNLATMMKAKCLNFLKGNGVLTFVRAGVFGGSILKSLLYKIFKAKNSCKPLGGCTYLPTDKVRSM